MEVATIPVGTGIAGPPPRVRLRSACMPDLPGMEEVGRRVRAARGYADLSQAELGKLVGISEDRLTGLEHGSKEAKPWELWGIAEVCGLPRSWFTVDWRSGGESNVSEIEQALEPPESNPGARSAGRRRTAGG